MQALDRWRLRQGWSDKQLSARLGFSHSWFSHVRAGRRHLTLKTIQQVLALEPQFYVVYVTKDLAPRTGGVGGTGGTGGTATPAAGGAAPATTAGTAAATADAA